MNRKAADYYHPAVSFLYSISLAVLAMLFFHPVFIVLGLFFAIIQNLILRPAKQLFQQLVWSLPFSILIALINPLTSHGGKTLLFYFMGNPVTFEAAFYGICSGGLLLLVFLWFGVYNRIVAPDRFLYLFSRLAPAASMLVTMTQRMIPLFARRFSLISAAQKTLRPQSEENGQKFRQRLSARLDEISILLGWSMEEGLDTADSMKARGYGSRKRSSFSVYRFTLNDAISLLFILLCDVSCVFSYYHSVQFRFYPRITTPAVTAGFVIAVISYLLLASALPFMEAFYALLWRTRTYKSGKALDYSRLYSRPC